jgi:hypothetical protein
MPATVSRFRGSLLVGNDNENYNPHLSCKDAFKTMSDSRLFWDAVELDSEMKNLTTDQYLSKATELSSAFLARGEIWNHEQVQSQLDRILSTTGGTVFLTGGPKTGKSLLLRNIAKKSPGTVLYLDARITGTNIEQALLSELNLNYPALFDRCVRSVFPMFSLPMTPGDKQAQLFHLMKTQNMILPNFFRELVKISPPFTLIFDDAELYFSQENTHNLGEILQVLLEMSNLSREMNLILASSDYNFPYYFTSLRINLSEHIVMSDLSPSDANRLLMEWEVGPHLATTLVNHFGGHVRSIASAIENLKRIKQKYHSAMTYDAINHAVQLCLARILNTLPLQTNTYSALKSLAEDGFVELKQNDPLADHLSKNRIAGFVPYDLISSPISKFHYNRRVMIPSLQMVRMVIAATLAEEE